jgi:hypothetical protein
MSMNYELVLSDLQMESPDSGLKVLAHATMIELQARAHALFQTYQNSTPSAAAIRKSSLLITPEDIPELLGRSPT